MTTKANAIRNDRAEMLRLIKSLWSIAAVNGAQSSTLMTVHPVCVLGCV